MILQALLLVTKQAEPIKGLLKGIHSSVERCPFLHSPVPLKLITKFTLYIKAGHLEDLARQEVLG